MISKIIKYAFFKKLIYPIDIILHITSKCNSYCQTCFNWKNLNFCDNDLSIDEFEKIAKGLKEILWLNISGGEPFLRDDLLHICELFYKLNKPRWVSISTNGLLTEKIQNLTEQMLNRIKIPIVIDLSLDNLYELHDELRGVRGNFIKVMQTYRSLVNLAKKYPNLSIKVITVLSNKNFERLDKIIKFVRYEMEGVFFHSNVFLRGNPREADIYLPNVALLETKKKILADACRNSRHNNNFSWIEQQLALFIREYLLNLNFKILREKRQVIPCLAGESHTVILANGDVSFCELIDSIGNLRDYDFNFTDIWYSKKARDIRQFIKDKKCYCTHECVHLNSILFNKFMYLSLTMSFIRDFFNSNSIRHQINF